MIVATGYKSEKIDEYLKSRRFTCDIQTVNSGEVDIIKRLRDAGRLTSTDLLVLYGDTLSNVNIDQIIKYHRSHEKKATITVWPLRSQFGLLEVDDKGTVISFKEKPVLDKWINIGYFYFDKEVVSWLDDFPSFEAFIDHLTKVKELKAYKHKGMHITVNTLKELEEAEKNISQMNEVFGV